MRKNDYMHLALDQARAAAKANEVPVGAVVVTAEGRVLAATQNRMRRDHDPTAHAEILAIRAASAAIGSERLTGATLYVTLEPCPMCAGAIGEARLSRLYYGAADIKGGAVDNGIALFNQPSCHHAPEVYGGLFEGECAALLKEFFAQRRKQRT